MHFVIKFFTFVLLPLPELSTDAITAISSSSPREPPSVTEIVTFKVTSVQGNISP